MELDREPVQLFTVAGSGDYVFKIATCILALHARFHGVTVGQRTRRNLWTSCCPSSIGMLNTESQPCLPPSATQLVCIFPSQGLASNPANGYNSRWDRTTCDIQL